LTISFFSIWMDAATENERRPTVAIDDMPEPAAGVMRMSADDGDQAVPNLPRICPAATHVQCV